MTLCNVNALHRTLTKCRGLRQCRQYPKASKTDDSQLELCRPLTDLHHDERDRVSLIQLKNGHSREWPCEQNVRHFHLLPIERCPVLPNSNSLPIRASVLLNGGCIVYGRNRNGHIADVAIFLRLPPRRMQGSPASFMQVAGPEPRSVFQSR